MTDHPLPLVHLAALNPMAGVGKSLFRLGINHVVIYLVFGEGKPVMLSNINSGCHEALYQHYSTMSSEIIEGNLQDYFLNTEGSNFSKKLGVLVEKYHTQPTYHLIRRHSECTFLLSAFQTTPTQSAQVVYEQTYKEFERVCIHFVDTCLAEIRCHNPLYQYSFILTNKVLRDAVIKQGYDEAIRISCREQDCLWLAAQGNSVKQIAKHLNLSPFTVERHLKNIRDLFHCHSLIEAIVAGIHRGLIGKSRAA